jgi:hypothetical protein
VGFKEIGPGLRKIYFSFYPLGILEDQNAAIIPC